jgi:hypothetical protein
MAIAAYFIALEVDYDNVLKGKQHSIIEAKLKGFI